MKKQSIFKQFKELKKGQLLNKIQKAKQIDLLDLAKKTNLKPKQVYNFISEIKKGI